MKTGVTSQSNLNEYAVVAFKDRHSVGALHDVVGFRCWPIPLKKTGSNWL
jgi:hypothetical protein